MLTGGRLGAGLLMKGTVGPVQEEVIWAFALPVPNLQNPPPPCKGPDQAKLVRPEVSLATRSLRGIRERFSLDLSARYSEQLLCPT